MATGGYKLVSFSWAGGRTDSALDRCKYILYNFCKAIVDANMGWTWDDDWVADGSINDYRTMGGHSDSYPNIAYVLTNTVDNVVYRAIVCLNYSQMVSLREQDCLATYTGDSSTSGYRFPGCLYVGTQKGGKITWDSTYGYHPNDSNPGQWLKWMALSCYKNSAANSFAANNDSSSTYTYFCLIKGAQLGFFGRRSTWTQEYIGNRLKGFLCGEIFKTTAHSADSNTFGSIYLGGLGTFEEPSQQNYNWASILANTPQSQSDGIQFAFLTTGNVYQNNTFSQIFKANGELLAGCNPLPKERVQLQYDLNQVNNWTCNTVLAPGGRWTPCYVYYATQDQSTNGVVPGDSFKGFLDTDLIRGVNPQTAYGEVLGANGEFVHIGGGFAIGWDPSNTVSFF